MLNEDVLLVCNGEIYNYKEWHDAFVFTRIMNLHQAHGLQVNNLSPYCADLNAFEASPLVRYMYHNKGLLKFKQEQAGQEAPQTKVKATKTEESSKKPIVVTPQDTQINVSANTISLLNAHGVNEGYSWKEFFEQYGEFQASTSKLKLRRSSNIEDSTEDIVGTIAYNPTNDNQLIFTIDSATLPTNTQTAVLKIIDPQKNYPGDGTLAAAATGQRYLIINDIPAGTQNWGSVSASANDIIQFNGTQWEVSFDASVNGSTVQYVTNTATNYQYKWTGTEWIDTYQGTYKPGYWILNLSGT